MVSNSQQQGTSFLDLIKVAGILVLLRVVMLDSHITFIKLPIIDPLLQRPIDMARDYFTRR